MENQNRRQDTPVEGYRVAPARDVDERQRLAVESQLDLNALALDGPVEAREITSASNTKSRFAGIEKQLLQKMTVTALVVLAIGGVMAGFISYMQRQADLKSAAQGDTSKLNSQYDTVNIPLSAFSKADAGTLSQAAVLTINGRLVVNNTLVLAPVNQPATGINGQLYYDKSSNKLRYYNGTEFVDLLDSQTAQPQTIIGGLSGAINLGNGLSTASGSLTNSGVTSLQGLSGNVSLSAGRGIIINGTSISASGVQAITAGAGIAIVSDGNSGVTVTSTATPGYDFSTLAANGIVISNGDGTLASVGSTAPGQCLVSASGGPAWQACPGTASVGTVTTAGGTPGRLAKFSGSLELDDSLLSETGSTVNIAGDINLSAGFRFFVDGQQLATTNLSDNSDICKVSVANCAPGVGSFIQNGTVQQASANFNISGNGTATNLNATGALQLGGLNINTAGTLSNVAYLNQNNSFTGSLTIGGSVNFSGLGSGIVSSSASGLLSSGTLDRNNPTLMTGVLTVANGGTGLGLITANGLIYGNGTATAGVTAAGTAGQIVIANASQVPTFVSVSGDIGISANGVVALGNGVVTNVKLANSSLTVTAGSNLTGGGLVALGGSITVDVTNAPSFSGSVNSVGGYQLNGSSVVTSAGILQNVTANANIITSGTLAIARGGTGLSSLPGNGQLLIGNGSGYTLGGLVAGSGIVINNAAGTITVSVDNTVCTTANNCMNPAPGSSYYIQNGTTQQAGSNFNVDGSGVASIFNALSALQLNGVSINTAGTLSNVAYLNQSNSFSGSVTVGSNLTVTTGVVTIGSLGAGLVSSTSGGVLVSSVLDRNDSSLLSGTLATGYGGTGVTGTPTSGQLLIGTGSGYALATLSGADGITITNAAGAITVGLNNTVCSTTSPCESPPAGGSTNYIQNGTVQQAGADFNISGGGTADRFNAISGLFIGGVNINTAGTLSNVAYLNQANTFSGNLSIGGSANLTVDTGVVRFGGLSTGIVQSSASGTLSSGAIDRNAASYFTNALSTANGGTGNTSFTANGLLFGNGPASLGVTAAGTAGQLLLANASGVPTFTSVSGDIAISAAGVMTIANGVVSNAKLVNSSLTVAAGTNLTGGGLVALGDTVTINVTNTPTFTGNVDAASFSRAGTTIITSSSVLQNVTANANIITSGTLPIARGGTGVTTLPGNGQLLIGNGSGYSVATLTAGSGVTITNAAGAITVSIDNSVCTTANNCPNPAPGSSFYIQNGTGQQTTANFNIDGVGIASAFNAVTAYRLNGVDINDAGTLSNVAYLNQTNTFSGGITLAGSNSLTVSSGAVTFGSLGAGLVQANASGVLSSGSVSRNSSALFSDTLSIANGGTGVTAIPTAGQLLIGNGTGYTVASLTAGSGISITNAAGAITVAVNASVCSSTNPCTSPPAGGSTNYIQNGTVQQASADFNISGGGTATTFNATGALQLNGSNINTAGTLSNVAYLNQANSFAGSLTVASGNFSVTSGSVTFGSLGAGIVQTNASGVISSSQVDRNSASLFSNNLSVANGGTGRASLAANGLLFGNGAGAVNVTNAGTGGQLLLADATGVPTFVSVTGDIAISANGVTSIQNGSVSNAKLANSSITVNSSANLVGGGTVALGGTLNLSVSSSPSFSGTINAVGGYQLNGSDIVTGSGTLQNVTANANIITSGTLEAARGGTGVSSIPTNGQLLIGNGTGYALANLTQGGGITITNGAGSISIAVDSSICTTANNCGYQAGGGGSGDYIQNTTTQQASSNFNISGTGIASTLNATTALQTAGTTRIDASGNVTAASITANGAATFTGATAGTTALSVKAASGSGDIFNVKTTANASALYVSSNGTVNLTLGAVIAGGLSVTGGITSSTDIKFANSGFTSSLTTDTLTASRTFTLPDSSGMLCTTTSCIRNSATMQTNANLYIQGNGGGSTVARFRAAGSQTVAIVRVDDSAGNALGGFNATGQLFNQSGSLTGTLSQSALTVNRTYSLPDASGTICLDSNNCGYLTTTAASTSYIQNTSTQQAGSNFNISGNGVIGGTLNVAGTTTLNSLSSGNATFSGNTSFSGSSNSFSTQLGVGISSSSAASLRVQAPSTSGNGILVWTRAGNSSAPLRVATQDNYQLFAVGTDGTITLGNSGAVGNQAGSIRLQDGVSGGYYAQISSGSGFTANRSFTLPDNDGVLCTTTTCAAAGSGNYINNGTTLQSANFFIRSAATGSVTALIQGSNGQSVDTFQVQDYQGNNFLSVSNAGNVSAGNQFTTNGAVGIQAGASTTKALQITTNSTTQTGLQIDAGTATSATNVFAAYGSTYGLTFNGAGVLNNTGSTTLGGTLNVSGATTITTLSATNGAFSGTLGVTGNTTLGGTLAVTGTSTFTAALTANGGISTTTVAASTSVLTPVVDTATATGLSIGTTNATSIAIGSTSLNGAISVGRSTQTNTVNIANGTIAAGQTGTVNIATNATGTGKTNVTIGSSNAASATTVQSGTGGLSINSGTGSTTLKSASTTGFQVQDGNYGTPVINVDTATAYNLVQNSSFEAGTTTPTSWTSVGSPSSFTKNNTNSYAYDGSGSLRLATTATTGQGFRGLTVISVAASTYTVSFYAMMETGTMASNLWQVTTTGGATSTATCAAGVTLSASGFQRVSCTVTTTGTTNAISITQTDATARTVYVDAINFISGTNYAYQQLGSIQLLSAITSPVLFQNASNSTSAFTIQSNQTNTYLFTADTLNSRIGIGTNAAAYTLDVAGDINSSTSYRINGIAGASTTCSGGAVLQNQVVSGGLTTGGSCVSVAAASGSANYIQNTTTQQTANFNVSGNGTIGGVLQVTGDANFSRITASGASTMGSLEVGGVGVGTIGNTQRQIVFYGGANNHSFEIGRQDGVASTPYFDFHSGATAVDYDARILTSGGTGSNGGATLNLTAATTNVSSNLAINGTTVITSARVLQNVTADAGLITSGTLGTARLAGSYTGITGVGALTAGSIASGFGTISTGSDITTSTALQGATINATTGFRVNGAAAAGQFLRGNGTNFVSSALQAGDIVAGSTNYIQNGTAQQTASNFNISGAGVIGTSLNVGLTGGTATITARGSGTNDILALQRSNGGTAFSVDQYANTTLYGNQIVNNAQSIGYGYQVTTAQLAVLNMTAANTGIQIQGAASQTGNLLQFRDNSGNTLSGFNATGQFYSQSGSYTGTIAQASLSANQTYTLPSTGGTLCTTTTCTAGSAASFIANQTTQQASSNFNISGAGIIGTTLQVGGATSTANLSVAATAGTVAASFSSVNNTAGSFSSSNSNGIYTQGTYGIIAQGSQTSALFQTNASNNVNNTVVIKGGSGQTGDLLNLQDSSSNTLGGFNNAGNLFYYNSGYVMTVGSATLSGNRSIIIPNSTAAIDTVCLQTLANCGGSSGSYIVNGTSLQTGNFNIQAVNTSNPTARIVGYDGQMEILSVVDGKFGRTLLSVNQNSQSVIIDSSAINYGGLDYGLRFGNASSGEGISSKKSGGTDNNGLSFFTSNVNRMIVLQNGNVCINNINCTAKLGVTGTIAASGSITANTTPDIAEMIAAAPDVEAADVVMADPSNTERVVKASGVYSSAAVGVISDGTSSFMINSYGGINGGKPLVLAGRVPVKVTNENGDIKPGDHLTVSSTTGHAMKATRAGATIGTALGFFNGTTGTVLVLVNPSYYDPFDGNNLQASTATISTLNATNAVITNLTVGTLAVTGNITVGGHIITAGNTPVITQNTALCTDTVLSINGNDTAGEIVVKTGTGCANNGLTTGTLGSVTFSTPYGKAPRIVMTPSNSKAATMSKTFIDGDTITANGFNVDTLDTLAPNTTYRWYYHSLE